MKLKDGDVEEQEDGRTFVRLWYDENQLKKINERYNSHLSMTEWVTVVVNKGKVEKIVAYSEEDNKEYQIKIIKRDITMEYL
mgnify:CR=1 FL=1